MQVEIGKYKVDIDIEKTKAFYKEAAAVSETCSCDGCLNFEKAIDVLSPGITKFFADIGIDMRKVCECFVLGVNENGTLLYGGFYHICGTFQEGKSERQKNELHRYTGPDYFITPDFGISFREEIDLPEPDFPAPIVQLEFSADIPWVLNKENSYL